jgi:type IV pilus assembly protein PilM
MNIFGLDIGSNSIKVCQTIKDGKTVKLVSVGLVASPVSNIVSESEQDIIDLAEAIKKLRQDSQISTKKVVLGMGETQVFSRILEFPKMKEEELAEALPWEAEQVIPMPLEKVNLDWQVLKTVTAADGTEKIKVLMIAAPISLIQKYQKITELAGLELIVLETELLAASRVLVGQDCAPTIIVDIGYNSTDFGIVNKGTLAFTRSIPTSGGALTRVIASSLSMDIAQADQYKMTYGLLSDQLEGKIGKIISPVVKVIIDEVKKVQLFWNSNENEAIKSIILYGGSANLPGLTTLLNQALGIEVQIGNPFGSLVIEEKLRTSLLDKSGLLTVAIGLSQKEI